jgi:hypothetical protein
MGFYIPHGDIHHSHRREDLKTYIALTGWALQKRRNVSPVRYEIGFYILQGGLLPQNVHVLNVHFPSLWYRNLTPFDLISWFYIKREINVPVDIYTQRKVENTKIENLRKE